MSRSGVIMVHFRSQKRSPF